MDLLRLFIALAKSGLLSFSSIKGLYEAILKHGLNLMTLLSFAAKKYGPKRALIDDITELTYAELLTQSMHVASYLKQHYHIESNQKIGIYCRNHAMLVKVIFALSRLGTNLYLINTEISKVQFEQLAKKQQFDFFIYDMQFSSCIHTSDVLKQTLCITEIEGFLNKASTHNQRLQKTNTSNVVLLTSGTTGLPKEVIHKPSLFNYLNPFIGMVQRLKLVQYKNGYIATPLYHGYGIAILFLFIALGKEVILSEQFHSTKACRLIEKHQVEIVTVVPLMIHKMLKEKVADLSSIRCIASGGAMLSANLAEQVKDTLGDVLYNLYGTSETGLNIIATPKDLSYSFHSIGKGIKGINIKIVNKYQKNNANGSVGQIWVKSKASMINPYNHWIPTGDLGYKDEKGYFYLVGRADDMIVSAGENVYPHQVETILLEHPIIEDVAVIGIPDKLYGQRLHAFIQTEKGENLTQEAILEWLKQKVARYEVPKEITFIDAIPYTSLGKKDKIQLTHYGFLKK